jgi:hypothetical protein
MSARVIILPIVPRGHPDGAVTLRVTLARTEYARLKRLAKEWKLDPDAAVSAIVNDALQHRFSLRGRR